MTRIMKRTFVAVALAVAVLALTGAPANAELSIRPNQHFYGLVNGTRTSAVVYTVCAGPVSAGRTGSVAGGQTLAVAPAWGGHGYTGPFAQVYAWFVPQNTA